MLKLLVTDDHALLRSGLRRILEGALPGAEVAEARSADETLELLRVQSYGVLLLDISMPGRSGLDVLREIRSLRPEMPVLVLSMHTEQEYAIRALQAGASGYVTKEMAPEELVEAIKRVLAGGRYISASLAQELAEGLCLGRAGARHEALSAREFEVLRHIGAGESVSAIAAELGLSVKTVSTYRARILEKMHMTTSAELMRYAMEQRLV